MPRRSPDSTEKASLPAGKSDFRNRIFGIREKLIGIFLAIKVLPLIFLAVLAARQIDFLGLTVKERASEMAGDSREVVGQVGSLAVESSIKALDEKARESIERLTVETAGAVATFLYERDEDILQAAQLSPGEDAYRRFLVGKWRRVVYHRAWRLSADGSSWQPPEWPTPEEPGVQSPLADNQRDFHYRPPDRQGVKRPQPLYHEMTFIGLDGREQIKVSATSLLARELQDVSDKANTWCRAEDYYAAVQSLGPGEIYVSRVIGPYVGSPIIGPYTPRKAEEMGIAFAPEKAGYAGKENPRGQRFQGLIRWVTPVYENGVKQGYVSLALDHTHLMEFTDHIIPTAERYSDISDAGSGNYAFMWDVEGRNISHPRDYFIVGYDPEKGEQAVPWLGAELYQLWQDVGEQFARFEELAPRYQAQSLANRPASPLTKAGMLGLDCRYLNFAPQCTGWLNLTQHGGSGSFVIFWSKLWKLTTAAAIPYYTSTYGDNPRGFGFVTIGANVDEFHSAATETASKIQAMTKEYESSMSDKAASTLERIEVLLQQTIQNLTVSTVVMVLLVMIIAVWMASSLTGKITSMIRGIRLFQSGRYETRLQTVSQDEMGQLATAFNEMSDEIAGSMEAIRKAKDRAEESDRAKSLFLANMSHEIRTPMSAIIGMSGLALDGCTDERQRRLLESVKVSADALLAVINDILDFSKIEAGQLDLENHTFSLPGLVRSTVKSIEVLAQDKELAVELEIGPGVPEQVSGDPMRLRQILLNLLGNAVKFTPQGVVGLRLESEPWRNGRVELRLTVYDSGEGISAPYLERIFERFSQGDLSISRKHQGTGLGLAISRKLCQLMGGDIRVTSEPGVGSTFFLNVFMGEPDESNGEDQPASGKHAGVRHLCLLLVEDNEANRELARMVLEGQGHEVHCAESGLRALHILATRRFDAVIMDVQMPEMDGFTATRVLRACARGDVPEVPDVHLPIELLAGLRRQHQGQHQPVIALTAHAMKGDKERCLEAGMDSYLTKPFIPEQVAATLRQCTGQQQGPSLGPPKSGTLPARLLAQMRENLKQAYGLADQQIEGLLKTTLSTIREEVETLKQQSESQNLSEMRATAHALKGVLLNMRLLDGAALAAELQRACEAGEADEASGLVAAISQCLAELVDPPAKG